MPSALREHLGAYLRAVNKAETKALVGADAVNFQRVQGRVQMLHDLAAQLKISLE